ncbi:hypothetical protein VPH35_075122 [Triticum aestivum]
MAANEGANGDEDVYDPMKDPARKPRRSNDPGWKYGYWYNPPSREYVVCNLCSKVTTGGIKRHKEHLAGCGGDAIGCPKATIEIRREMAAYLEQNKRNKGVDDDDNNNDVVEVNEDGTNVPITKPSSGTAAKRNKRAFVAKMQGRCKSTVASNNISKPIVAMLRRTPEELVDERRSGCSQSTTESSTKTKEEREYIHTKKRNRLQWKRLNDCVFVSYNRKMMHRFQKRCEKVGDTSFDPLVYEDFDWGNEWVDPTIPLPQGARGCPHDISWEDVDVAVGASTNLQGCNLPRTGTTLRRGPSAVHVQFKRHRKRPTATRPALLEEDWEEEDLEQEQHSSNPRRNEEEDDSDYVQDDDDVSNDDEDPTNDDQDGEENTNATMDEFDDGY